LQFPWAMGRVPQGIVGMPGQAGAWPVGVQLRVACAASSSGRLRNCRVAPCTPAILCFCLAAGPQTSYDPLATFSGARVPRNADLARRQHHAGRGQERQCQDFPVEGPTHGLMKVLSTAAAHPWLPLDLLRCMIHLRMLQSLMRSRRTHVCRGVACVQVQSCTRWFNLFDMLG
jgi:hypothetical protein